MGLDRGYNFQPQAPGGVGCGKARTTPLSAAYNDAAPMAQYKAGQKASYYISLTLFNWRLYNG
jgi:hypothetical protein